MITKEQVTEVNARLYMLDHLQVQLNTIGRMQASGDVELVWKEEQVRVPRDDDLRGYLSAVRKQLEAHIAAIEFPSVVCRWTWDDGAYVTDCINGKNKSQVVNGICPDCGRDVVEVDSGS